MDQSEQRIKAWNSDNLPTYVPALNEVMDIAPRIVLSTSAQEAIEEADIIVAQ